MKIKSINILILFLVLGMTAMSAFAQEQTPGRPGRPPGEAFEDRSGRREPPPSEKLEEVRKKVEAVRIWRLTEELKLDEKAAAKFLPIISAIEQKRRDIIRETMETTRELRLYLESKTPDEKKIKAALDKLEKIHHEMTKLQEKELEAAKDHLTIEQQARYILFQQEFQREMRSMIDQARGQGPGREDMRGGQGRPQGGPMDRDFGREMPPLPRR